MFSFCVAIIWFYVLFSNCCVWCQTHGVALPWLCFSRPVLLMLFSLLFLLLQEVKRATALPCDVLSKVVQGVYLQGAAAVCRVNSLNTDGAACLYTWQVHSRGSSPSSSIPSSLSLSVSLCLSHVSVDVCHSLCFFLSSAPAASVSIGLPVSVFFLCVSWCCSPVLQIKGHQPLM